MIDVIYIHVPFYGTGSQYQHGYGVPFDDVLSQRFARAVLNELSMLRLPLTLQAVYVGGGDPLCLKPFTLESLLSRLSHTLDLDDDIEFTVEGSCSSVSPESIQVLVQSRVNRFCMATELHEAETFGQAVQDIQAQGIESVGVDLYADWGSCSPQQWQQVLQATLKSQPGHVATYSTSENKTSDDREVERMEEAEQLLHAGGYEHYELWSHALPGHRSHFQRSTWALLPTIGLGPSAASNYGIRRWTNTPNLEEYLDTLEQGLPPPREVEDITPLTFAAEALAFRITKLEGVDLDRVETEVHRRFPRVGKNDPEFSKGWKRILTRFQLLEADGLVERAEGKWALTLRGRRMADLVQLQLMLGESTAAL
jgi:oxygen-independent coproporphyrinogen-3 oxidase